MEIELIKTEANYKAELEELEMLMNSERDTPEGDRLDVLTTLVEVREKRIMVKGLDPIDAMLQRLEALGLVRKDAL